MTEIIRYGNYRIIEKETSIDLERFDDGKWALVGDCIYDDVEWNTYKITWYLNNNSYNLGTMENEKADAIGVLWEDRHKTE